MWLPGVMLPPCSRMISICFHAIIVDKHVLKRNFVHKSGRCSMPGSTALP